MRRIQRLSGSDETPTWRGRSHLLAFVLAVPLGIALVLHHRDWQTGAYVAVLLLLFGISSVYHLLPMSPARRDLMRKVDHAMIFVFIGVSYDPLARAVAPGTFGDVVCGLALLIGLTCAAVKFLHFGRSRVFGGVMYMGLGWMGVVLLPDAFRRLSGPELALLGGMVGLYMVGSLVLLFRHPDPVPHHFGYHEIWHACVVAAAACYFVLVWLAPA